MDGEYSTGHGVIRFLVGRKWEKFSWFALRRMRRGPWRSLRIPHRFQSVPAPTRGRGEGEESLENREKRENATVFGGADFHRWWASVPRLPSFFPSCEKIFLKKRGRPPENPCRDTRLDPPLRENPPCRRWPPPSMPGDPGGAVQEDGRVPRSGPANFRPRSPSPLMRAGTVL